MPSPTASPATPRALNLFRKAGFRYQDPNYVACTATSVMSMLNFIALGRSGGDHFRWIVSLKAKTRDAVLAWERAHDTIVATAKGSDPHGWRNALNVLGWGSSALTDDARVYEDRSFDTFSAAVRTAVRQMILTRKPVGMAGWAGHHAQMITGYYGLDGDPFAQNADGTWTDDFTVQGFYVSDPLRADRMRNKKVAWTTLKKSSNLKIRFQQYLEIDSPYDDPYTAGVLAARSEWYGHFVLLIPVQ